MSTVATIARKWPAGAEVVKQGVHFRLWAPRHQQVELVLLEPDGQTIRQILSMDPEAHGYYSLLIEEARAAARLGIDRNTLHKKLKDYGLEENNDQ